MAWKKKKTSNLEAAFEGKPLSQMVKHRTLVSEAARLRKFESRPKTTKKKKLTLKRLIFFGNGFFFGLGFKLMQVELARQLCFLLIYD